MRSYVLRIVSRRELPCPVKIALAGQCSKQGGSHSARGLFTFGHDCGIKFQTPASKPRQAKAGRSSIYVKQGPGVSNLVTLRCQKYLST